MNGSYITKGMTKRFIKEGNPALSESSAAKSASPSMNSLRIPLLTLLILLFALPSVFGLGQFPPGDIWFPPVDRGDLKLKELLDSALMEIKFAFYDIKNDTIGQAILSAKARGILVKVVTDDDNAGSTSYVDEFEAAGIEVKRDSGAGLMHNKFAIIDNRYVWTGSYNVTDNGTFRNNNNAILIDDVMLANNFRVEFDEMFDNEQFGAGSPANTPNPVLSVNGVTVETYFSPDDGVTAKIVAEIGKATSFIYFEAFSFTSDPIFTALKERHDAGVYVKGIFETQQDSAASKYSKYKPLKRVGADVILDTNPNNMHNKLFIIDGNTLITGSFNFSASAEEKNDEAILIIRNTDVSTRYVTEFHRLFNLFTQGESVRGFVKNSATGTLVSGARVANLTTGSVTASDDLGWYRFLNVNSVNYRIRVENDGYFAYEGNLVEPVERHDVSLIQISDFGSVRGVVKNTSGIAVEGAAIEIRHTSATGVVTLLRAVSDANGAFTLQRVPAYMTAQDGLAVKISRQGFIDVNLVNRQVPKDGILDLGTQILGTNFRIGGFMNPVMEEYAIITVKDNSGSTTVPRVRVTQNNYVPVDVTMSLIPKTGFFTGPLKILPRYTGAAEIDVNDGQGRGSLHVFVLEPRTGTTVEASGKISVVFSPGSIVDTFTGILACDTDAEDELKGISGARVLSQAMSVTPTIRLAGQGMRVQMSLSGNEEITSAGSSRSSAVSSDASGSGGRVWLMHRSPGRSWQVIGSGDSESAVVTGQCMETGTWCLVEDNSAPAARVDETRPGVRDDGTQIYRVSVSDPISGVNWSGLQGFLGSRPIQVNALPEQNVALLMVSPSELSFGSEESGGSPEIQFSYSDLAGNKATLKIAALATADDLLTNVVTWPSPVRRGEKLTFRYSLAEPSLVRIHIYDSAADRIASPVSDDRSAGVNERDVWDLTDADGLSVPNGTYFFSIEARGASGRIQRRTGKFALLR